jgi:hypothetical protein
MKATTGAMSCFRNNTMMAEMILQKKLKGPEGLSLPCNFFYPALLIRFARFSSLPGIKRSQVLLLTTSQKTNSF